MNYKTKNAFQCLLRPELFLEISDLGTLKIKEHDKSASLRKLTIKKVPPGSVAFELDHKPTSGNLKGLKEEFKQLSCLINGQHSKANKSCDFVIITPGEQCSKIVLGELKSTKFKKRSCFEQLRNSELFVMYLLELLAEYHDTRVDPEFRKVVVHVLPANRAKALTQQRRRQVPKPSDDVTYRAVAVQGRNNAESVIFYQSF